MDRIVLSRRWRPRSDRPLSGPTDASNRCRRNGSQRSDAGRTVVANRQYRDIVRLGGAPGEAVDGFEDPVDDAAAAFREMALQDPLEALLSEQHGARIGGLGDAIGVEDDRVPRREADTQRLEVVLIQHT